LERHIFIVTQETGDRRQETGDRRQETGDRRQETGDRRQETGDRRQETGDRRQVGPSSNSPAASLPELGRDTFGGVWPTSIASVLVVPNVSLRSSDS
jgi:hypothetical protein